MKIHPHYQVKELTFEFTQRVTELKRCLEKLKKLSATQISIARIAPSEFHVKAKNIAKEIPFTLKLFTNKHPGRATISLETKNLSISIIRGIHKRLYSVLGLDTTSKVMRSARLVAAKLEFTAALPSLSHELLVGHRDKLYCNKNGLFSPFKILEHQLIADLKSRIFEENGLILSLLEIDAKWLHNLRPMGRTMSPENGLGTLVVVSPASYIQPSKLRSDMHQIGIALTHKNLLNLEKKKGLNIRSASKHSLKCTLPMFWTNLIQMAGHLAID